MAPQGVQRESEGRLNPDAAFPLNRQPWFLPLRASSAQGERATIESHFDAFPVHQHIQQNLQCRIRFHTSFREIKVV